MVETNKKLLDFVVETADLAARELRQRFCGKLTTHYKADSSLCTDADLASEKVILARIAKYFPDDQVLSEEFGKSPKKTTSNGIWIIDPLDGTSNFANQYPFFAVSIARAEIGEDGLMRSQVGAVADPVRERIFSAAKGLGAFLQAKPLAVAKDRPFDKAFLCTGFYYHKGKSLEQDLARFSRVANACQTIRRDGAAALDLALVAEGVFDGFWERGLQPWDVAAGSLLVSEAGGIVRNYVAQSHMGYDLNGEGIICGNASIVENLAQLI